MELRIKQAAPGKTWAYKDELGNEVVLGTTLYLGKNDNGSRYYEIDDPNISQKKDDIIVDNASGNVVQ